MSGTTVGKYRLDRVISKNATGTTFHGVHTDTSEQYVVRMVDLPKGREQAESVRKVFAREARLIAQLDHDATVKVKDVGAVEGKVYVVTEVTDGPSLGEFLKREGALEPSRAMRLAVQMTGSLAQAHQFGLVHQGLTPDCVFVVSGDKIKVGDYGVAHALSQGAMDADTLALTTETTTSYRYMAPELFTWNEGTPASDVYSLGLLVWEMLVGRPACWDDKLVLAMDFHTSDEPLVLPPGLRLPTIAYEAINRALMKAPEARFANAAEFHRALSQAGGTSPGVTPNYDDEDDDSPVPTQQVDVSSMVGSDRGAPEPRMIAQKYELSDLIGRGGFSRVYRGKHVEMARDVAIKLLDVQSAMASTGSQSGGDLQKRFSREARMVSQLKHPNTITVYDFGADDDGEWYIVMEFVDGVTLHKEIRKGGKMHPKRAAKVAQEILGSLSEAHHAGILHRDLKPGNIMLTTDYKGDELVKVLDFGIATATDLGWQTGKGEGKWTKMSATRQGMFVGTPQYAAPEQFVGGALQPSTDIYAVGLMLWEMLAGRPAVDFDDFGKCLQAHLTGDPWRLPDELGVPKGLADIVHGALVKDPAKRYQAAADMAKDLARWWDGEDREFAPSPSTEERWNPAFDYGEDDPEAPPSSFIGRPEAALPPPDRSEDPAAIIDPNLDPSFSPELLGGGSQRSTGPTFDPNAERGGRAKAPVRKKPKIPKLREERIELDTSALAPERGGTAPRRRATVEEVRPEPRRGLSIPDLPIGWILGGIVAVIAGGVVFQSMSAPKEPQLDVLKQEPMHLDIDEQGKITVPEGDLPDRPEQRRYSVQGILSALEKGGWRVKPIRDNRAGLIGVQQRGYKIARGSAEFDIDLLSTESNKSAQKLFEDTRSPIQGVLFDNRLVRIYPSPKGDDPAMTEVLALLRRYRDLVREGAEDSP